MGRCTTRTCVRSCEGSSRRARIRKRARGAGLPDGELEQAIRRAVLDRTGVAPHTVALLPPGTLPRTSSGKLRRREALRRWLAGT